MACGKPVIATNIGSIPEVIDDGINGILIPSGDHNELARQINRLLHDDKYATTLGSNARQKAICQFDLESMIDNTINAFELAIQQKNKPQKIDYKT